MAGCVAPTTKRPHAVLENSPAVLHLHWLWLNKDPLRNLLRKREIEDLLRTCANHSVPVVWTMHNATPHESSELSNKLWHHVWPRIDGIIVHSAASVGHAESVNKHARVRVIPHGPLATAYAEVAERTAARQLLGLPQRPTLLCFGQMRAYRGVPDLLAAFRRVAADATLLIAGDCQDGSLRRQIELMAKEDPRVHAILERVPDELVPQVFGAADWVALPYRAATTSGVANLALGMKRPLILPDIAALRDGIPSRLLAIFRAGEPLDNALAEVLQRTPPCADEFPAQPTWDEVALEHRRFFDELRRTCS